MGSLNRLIIATLVCDMLIIVAIGHGVIPMIFVEPMLLREVFTGETNMTLFGDYSTRLPACAITSMAGQVVMIVACFVNVSVKRFLSGLGLAIMYFALFVLSFGFSRGKTQSFSLVFSMPFLFVSVRLIISLFKIRMQDKEADASTEFKS